MTYLRLVLTLVVAFLMLSSCSNEEDLAPINIDNPYLSFDANGGTQTIYFTVNGGDWHAWVKPVDKGDWFSYTPNEGTEGKNTISISVLPFIGYNRSTVIEINRMGQYEELYIDQEGMHNDSHKYSVNIDKAGTLRSIIDEYESVLDFTLTGQINGDDIYILNDRIRYGLSILDLSNVKIVAGGGNTISYNNTQGKSPRTYDNEICEGIFPSWGGAWERVYGITDIKLPLDITAIRASAFAALDKITSITIPSKVSLIEKNAFSCEKLKTVYCNATNPPSLDENGFSANVYDGTLYVPKGTYEKYAAHKVWGKFTVIKEE